MRISDIFVFLGANFSDFSAEISLFSAPGTHDFQYNAQKSISFSCNQTYTTLKVISDHIEQSTMGINYIFVSSGGHFGDFSAEILPFSAPGTCDFQ